MKIFPYQKGEVMVKSLVEWGNGSINDYRDTGEGGLFAYAVWSTPKAECFMDVHPMLPAGDVLVDAIGPAGNDFTDAQKKLSSSYGHSDADHYKVFMDTSTVTGTVLFLGSVNESLHSESVGEYYRVARDTLTVEGGTIVDAISASYGEPTFLTYLDT